MLKEVKLTDRYSSFYQP